MKHYSPTGRRNRGRPLKRLLDTWEQNGTTSGLTAWQTYDDDDDDDDDRYIWNMATVWVSTATDNSDVSCQMSDFSFSILRLTKSNLNSPFFVIHKPSTVSVFSRLPPASPHVPLVTMKTFYYTQSRGRKERGLPLEFTYSECLCQKSAVFSTSIPAVTDVKVAWRPNKFYHHVVTPSDLRELYLIFQSNISSWLFYYFIHTLFFFWQTVR